MPCCFCGGFGGQPAHHAMREAGTLGLRAVLTDLRISWVHTAGQIHLETLFWEGSGQNSSTGPESQLTLEIVSNRVPFSS